MRQNPPNARFWVWANLGPVKITLKPGQTLHWGWGELHEEGYSSESHAWEHEGDVLTYQFTSDGRDCDGRLRKYHDAECPLDRLAVHLPPICDDENHDWSYEDQDCLARTRANMAGVLWPDWKETHASQRDEYAEAMGY